MDKRKWIDYEDVEKLASIEQIAEMLGLKCSRSRTQLRCACPVHGGDDRTLAISPDVRSKKGSLGVFFCQKDHSGGDRIGLVAHVMELGQSDAAHFISQQFGDGIVNSDGNSTGTVSKGHAKTPFDSAQFAAKLQFTEEVKALGYTDEEARAFRIGFYRGHVYIPQIYPSGIIAGWSKLDGNLVRPVSWQPDASNVVQLKKAG